MPYRKAKFQLKTPLRELCESIAGRIGGLDEELKTKMTEYNLVKGQLQQNERKAQGNLMVRSLTDIVSEAHMRGTIGSDVMATMLVVVPKHGTKEFLSTYETVAGQITLPDETTMSPVVPRSAKMIVEDSEMALFAVVVFKKVRCLPPYPPPHWGGTAGRG